VSEPSIANTWKQPFQEQLDYFRAKLNLPTEHWDDITGAAHDRAFIVAGAAKADLLNDLRQAVDKAIAQGTGIEAFRRDFAKIIQRTGWDYTGSFDWRTRVIYQTNLSSSYAAGRWAQLNDPALVKIRPYWKYVHADGVAHPRPLHVAWSGTILPRDDEWWQTHFPPNGWGCHCRVVAVSQRDYDAAHPAKRTAPGDGSYVQIDRNGVEHVVPNGIDYGFAHAPGASLNDLAKTIIDKAAGLPPELGKPLAEDATKLLRFEAQATTKAAEAWARSNDLADYVDYKGVKPEVANAFNESLFNHLQEFPALRQSQQFIGTCQGQFSLYAEKKRAMVVEKLITQGYDRATAEDYAKRNVPTPKVNGRAFAHSWAQKGVSGVGVNAKFGKDPATMLERLQRNVETKFHPPGTDTIRAIADHEFGHQLDNLLALSSDQSIIDLYKAARKAGITDEVSGYADQNIAEFIAECWAEACNTPEPRSCARTVSETVRARYRSRYPARGRQ